MKKSYTEFSNTARISPRSSGNFTRVSPRVCGTKFKFPHFYFGNLSFIDESIRDNVAVENHIEASLIDNPLSRFFYHSAKLQHIKLSIIKNSIDNRLLLCAGDIETNPGPKNKYPCGLCKQPVRGWSIKCVDCLSWFHQLCTNMTINELKACNNYKWHCGCEAIAKDDFVSEHEKGSECTDHMITRKKNTSTTSR